MNLKNMIPSAASDPIDQTNAADAHAELRRSSIALGLAALTAAAIGTAKPAKASDQPANAPGVAKVQLLAPRDSIIKSVATAAGHVVQGTVVVVFEPTEENGLLSGIELASSLLAKQEEALSDNAVQLRHVTFEQDKAIATAYLKYAQDTHTRADADYRLGAHGTDLEQLHRALIRAEAVLARANAEALRAAAAVDLFNASVLQAKDQLSLLKRALSTRQGVIQEQLAQLTLRAPVGGRLVLRGYQGGFAQKGSVVAELY